MMLLANQCYQDTVSSKAHRYRMFSHTAFVAPKVPMKQVWQHLGWYTVLAKYARQPAVTEINAKANG